MKNKKKLFASILIILLIILVFILEFTIGDKINTAFTDEKIYYTSTKYEYIRSNNNLNELSKYQLLVNNDQIYFYNKEAKEIVKDNSEVIKKVWYGESSCDRFKKENGKNINCEKTYDFFELYLCDSSRLLTVDKEGHIFYKEFEYDYNKETKKYNFYGNYWYGNVRVFKENSDIEIYIQEVYDSEGSTKINVIHKDENGRLSNLYRIDDFYLTADDKYMELNHNEITIYQDKKIIRTINSYDRIYDIYDGKYLLVKENNHLKLNNLNSQTIVDFGRISNKYNYLKIEEENGILYVYDERQGYQIFKFNMQGKVEYLEY